MELHKCIDCKVRSEATGFLSNIELNDLGENCVEVHFEKGETIFKQNALSSNIIYLKEGLVKLTLKGPHRDQILKIVKATAYLGIPTTVGDKINHYSAVAIDPSVACFIDLNIFRKLIHKNGKFAYEIVLELCKNELQQFHRCINLTQKMLNGRLAFNLLNFSRNFYKSSSFKLSLNRNDLADLLGTTRESVSRVLSDFSREGLIEMEGKNIKILDEEKLEMISKAG
ncbi:MAG: Crp/Fnr family transcriptional regulator [Bacteroidales bacterium]|nr:Crp/Fnr family transcriptional regulator [Bacteroidales bacterium]